MVHYLACWSKISNGFLLFHQYSGHCEGRYMSNYPAMPELFKSVQVGELYTIITRNVDIPHHSHCYTFTTHKHNEFWRSVELGVSKFKRLVKSLLRYHGFVGTLFYFWFMGRDPLHGMFWLRSGKMHQDPPASHKNAWARVGDGEVEEDM